jgi:kinesin family member 14
MSFATPKRVHFNRDIAKWSLGGKTPTIHRLSTTPKSSRESANNLGNNENSNSKISNGSLTVATPTISGSVVTSGLPSNESNQITVGVRVRPLNKKETTLGFYDAVKLNDAYTEITLNDRVNCKQHKFTCDFVVNDQQAAISNLESDTHNFESGCAVVAADNQQRYLYERIGRPLLDRAFDGYNVSIFAYGQTGSGKTYSMIGTNSEPGLIPRFFDELFERKLKRDQIVSSTHIEISYYEIYNEKIYDLLRSSCSDSSKENNNAASLNNRHLQIRENPQTGPYIVDLLTLSANTAADAKLWLDIGNKRRATACTNMNQKSSRSHSVFQINLTQMLEHSPANAGSARTSVQSTGNSLLQLVTSRINLVDLAGSERIQNTLGTGVNHLPTSNSSSLSNTPSSSSIFSYHQQQNSSSSRFKESTCINKSLLTLGKIICLLSDRQMSSNNSGSNVGGLTPSSYGYLPYRESVLTWLLKESLGGNAKTAILATINASSCYLDETLCTLRYAAKAACIKNAAHLNRNFRQKYINEFGQEMEMNLVLPPMSSFSGLTLSKGSASNRNEINVKGSGVNTELQETLKQMEQEWKQKLEEAERLKQKEINDLEKSLIVLYENETRAQNCCLINLNEDPLLSEKLIYLLKSCTTTDQETIESASSTLIGSDKNSVDIHLTGPLIASIHCKIYKTADGIYYIEQIDNNYVTYLNGEVINESKRQLNHCDRIIIGGSHFFRFNNPATVNKQARSITGVSDTAQFKDYQFAKNEIEKKQNELIQEKLQEALSKCKQDGDMRIKELKQKYEQNIESIVSNYILKANYV